MRSFMQTHKGLQTIYQVNALRQIRGWTAICCANLVYN